ncbi:ABC transporter permease [Anaerosporobacter sp.]|uniref:ABC transporter permease n=1 Tax=Anaerosporobacter sp. TaxID=1872529 RepID=UPI00286F26E1|nr:FtsX-like permease family protein [Anaerosporobacter sp.]
MSDLKSISIRFLKRSKVLTVSCLLSVFIATVLIIEMFNLSMNATESYKQSVKAMYGDCDAGIHYVDYRGFNDEIVDKIANLKEVSDYATLMYSSEVRIAGGPVYTVGTDNSKMVSSRYNNTKILSQNEIAINEVLAKVGNYKLGDCIEVNNVTLEVAEIFKDKTSNVDSVEMAVVCKEMLQKITKKDYNTNVIMIKSDDVRNAEYVIKRLDADITTVVFEGDELYEDMVEAFQFFVIVLSVCIALVTSLFTLSVFRNFIHKYRRDLATLRLIGGTTAQTKRIFKHMIRIILLLGIGSGFFVSYLFNTVVMNTLNNEINIITGESHFFFVSSLEIAAVIFVIIYVLMTFMIRKSGEILPIEVLRNNEASKRKKKRTKGIRILKSDLYIARKMVKVRVKDNTIMLLTIAMLVAVSIVGASFTGIVKKNGAEYYKNKYLAETIVTTSSSVTLQEAEVLYTGLREDDEIKVSAVYTTGYRAEYNGETMEYMIADMDAMIKQNILPITEFSESSMIISESFAEAHSMKVSDVIEIKTADVYKLDANGYKIGVEKEGTSCTMQIAGIMKDGELGFRDAYVDIHNKDFPQDAVWIDQIYIDGDSQYIEDKLENLRGEYSYLKWSNYSEVVRVNDKEIENRYFMIEMVVRILVIISSIGWINSLRNIFISRTKDYGILRLQGVSRMRLAKMMIYQILYYLLSGIVCGMVIGCALVEALLYSDLKRFAFDFDFSIVYEMIIIMLLFCLLLVPLLKRICNRKVVE